MLLNFKNSNLVSIINLLSKIELKGKYSRSRTKVNNILIESLKELQEDEKKLLAEFSNKDDEGEVIMLNDNTYDVPTEKQPDLIKAKNELLNEIVSIDPAEKKQHFLNLKETLENLDILLKDEDAVAYDLILDELEGIEE